MSDETMRRIRYAVACVSEFARAYSLSQQEAYRYLAYHDGISFLKECYDAEHTLSMEDAVRDLAEVCRQNGGKIA